MRGHAEGTLCEVKETVWAGMAGRFGQTLDGRLEQRGSSGGYSFPATVGHSVMARWSSWGAGVVSEGCRGRVTCRAGCGAVSRHTGGKLKIRREDWQQQQAETTERCGDAGDGVCCWGDEAAEDRRRCLLYDDGGGGAGGGYFTSKGTAAHGKGDAYAAHRRVVGPHHMHTYHTRTRQSETGGEQTAKISVNNSPVRPKSRPPTAAAKDIETAAAWV